MRRRHRPSPSQSVGQSRRFAGPTREPNRDSINLPLNRRNFVFAALEIRQLDRPVAVIDSGKHRGETKKVRLRDRDRTCGCGTSRSSPSGQETRSPSCRRISSRSSDLAGVGLRACCCRPGPSARRRETRRRACAKLVTGKLLANKVVVGRVGVQRADHVVAIRPGVVARRVYLISVRFAEPHHVEPVPGPTLAIARRSQQAIRESFESVGRRVGRKNRHVLGRRRQTDQVEVQPPDKRLAVGLGRRRESGLREPGDDECVDWIAGSGIVGEPPG